MRNILKGLGVLAIVAILSIIGILTYVTTVLPDVEPAPDLQIELTNERIERGRYLANNVMVCTHCHSPQERSKFAHPLNSDSLGAGGILFGTEEGLPGNYFSANLTPSFLGDWTDGEIYRAITTGVSKDGRALFPIMPYQKYAKAEKEDIYSVIAYLRTLDPIENEVPLSESFFPMNFIINTIPKAPTHEMVRDTTNPVSWGKYLVTVASCSDCHTPKEKGADIPGMQFAGGFEFPMIDKSIVRTANITPDNNTGIGTWSEEEFVNRFKSYADTSFEFKEIAHGTFNTSMPWKQYSQMSEQELKAIYAYLRTVEPVEHTFERFTPAE